MISVRIRMLSSDLAIWLKRMRTIPTGQNGPPYLRSPGDFIPDHQLRPGEILMNTPSPAEQAATAPVAGKRKHGNTSIQLLSAARDIQEERARNYDQPGGERSMDATTKAFNIITRRTGDRALTESEGFLLMQILKDVRDRSTEMPHLDSIEDCVSYAALKGEARLRENKGEM